MFFSRIRGVFSKIPAACCSQPCHRRILARCSYNNKVSQVVWVHRGQFGFSTKSNWEEYIDTTTNVEELNQFSAGSLIVCATPIGNLADMSIRQYQALMHADIIVCEDVKYMGVLLHLAKNKRTSESVSAILDQITFTGNSGILTDGDVIDCEDDSITLTLGQIAQEIQEGQQTNEQMNELMKERIVELKKQMKSLLKESGKRLNVLDEEFDDEVEKKKMFSVGSSYGLEEAYLQFIRAKVDASKKKKGRGIMVKCKKGEILGGLDQLTHLIQLGFNVALVSKSGTPTIADDSFKIVNKCLEEDIQVTALPGASSAIVAMSKSGYPADRFEFAGNIKEARVDRESQLTEIRDSEASTVAYLNVDILLNTLLSIEKVFGEKQQVCLCFDMTQEAERYYRGDVRELYEAFSNSERQAQFGVHGDLTLVIPPFTPSYNKGLLETDHAMRKRKFFHMEWEADTSSQSSIPVEPKELALILANNLDTSDENVAEIVAQILRVPLHKAMSLLHFAKLNEKREPKWDEYIDTETLQNLSKKQKKKRQQQEKRAKQMETVEE